MIIPDLTKATAGDIDPILIEKKLWNIQRFQGQPGALSVRQHTHLVRALAIRDNASEAVTQWCFHHDDHEALIGDIHGRVITRINKETDFLLALTNHLDRCICERRKIDYPTLAVRDKVHYYDKLAESLECRFGLGWAPFPHHPEWPEWLDFSRAKALFRNSRMPNPFK